jgi:transposase-like protein
MIITEYLKTECPHCGSRDHTCYGTHRHGKIVVRYHFCKGCGRTFASHDE